MDRLMHNHGNLSPSPRGGPRVKSEGDPNYTLDKGKRMERLINEYLKHDPSPRPAPRVKPGKTYNPAIHSYYPRLNILHNNFVGLWCDLPQPVCS